jgi:hypothetical protein
VSDEGDEVFSDASPQREGVLEDMWVFGEKQALSNGSVDSASKEKPNENCSSLPSGAASDGCREVEWELILLPAMSFVVEAPLEGNVAYWPCSLGKIVDTSADGNAAWSKKDSSENPGDVV